MYLDHFGLKSNPFGLTPRIDFVYPSGAFEENMAHLIYGLENSEAITMITGPVGSGKTLAVQNFLAKLGSQFSFALVTNTQVNSIELLKLILDDLEVETPIGCDKSDLLIIFKNYLLNEHKNGHRVLIVIDEAQNLALDALEEVRLLTNLGQGDYQPVQIVLVGQPELDVVINKPGLGQLRQRIRVHYRLTPLLADEIEEYLNHRMAVGGCQEHVFKPLAVKRISEFSNGIPRLVNALANAALLSAFVGGRKKVEGKDVDPEEAGLPGESATIEPEPDYLPPKPKKQEAPAPPPSHQPDDVAVVESDKGGSRKAILVFVLVAIVLIPAAMYFTGNLDGLIEKFKVEGYQSLEVVVHPPQTALEPAPEVAAVADTIPVVATDQSALDKVDSDNLAILPVEPRESQEPPQVLEVLLVHVASFQHKEDADRYAVTLRGQNHAARVKYHTIGDQEWYRVYLGPFADQDLALADVENLKRDEGLTYYQIIKTTD